jgi:putative hydrolase of the HAD superfamily
VTIKAICFDADGVVINPQLQFSRYLDKEHGISPEMKRDFFGGVFNDCLVGRADLKKVLPTFLRDWGWPGTTDEFVDTWLRTDHVVDRRIINVIESLRRKGYICCLATSQEYHRARYMKVEMGFQDVFDHLFFSCEVGWQKPDQVYYQHIEHILHLEKESILLWDDSRINIEAARKYGWNAEIYTGYAEFGKTIKKYIA